MPPGYSWLQEVRDQKENSHPFSNFQNLPELVQLALCCALRRGEELRKFGQSGELTEFLIDRYDRNEMRPIGTLIEITGRFTQNEQNCRMVNCFIDAKCDMMLAKLMWREDY